ncbi:MAG TPA: hypothetical protein VM658_02175 [bacterium]|nr:hypothetical protein [bacterium]
MTALSLAPMASKRACRVARKWDGGRMENFIANESGVVPPHSKVPFPRSPLLTGMNS